MRVSGFLCVIILLSMKLPGPIDESWSWMACIHQCLSWKKRCMNVGLPKERAPQPHANNVCHPHRLLSTRPLALLLHLTITASPVQSLMRRLCSFRICFALRTIRQDPTASRPQSISLTPACRAAAFNPFRHNTMRHPLCANWAVGWGRPARPLRRKVRRRLSRNLWRHRRREDGFDAG